VRDVLQYFNLIVKVIEFSDAVSSELEFEELDHKRGTIEGALYFGDGSRLEFTERIVIDRGRPVKRQYRYQYVRGGESAVFRYDNAPHHPNLQGFPHHKHVGRKTLSASEPSLKQVLQEVSALLPEELASHDAAPHRRTRQRRRVRPQKS
jgi:hypothetical protein